MIFKFMKFRIKEVCIFLSVLIRFGNYFHFDKFARVIHLKYITVHLEINTIFSLFRFSGRVRALSSALPEAGEEERSTQAPRMEESFTIHLGM